MASSPLAFRGSEREREHYFVFCLFFVFVLISFRFFSVCFSVFDVLFSFRLSPAFSVVFVSSVFCFSQSGLDTVVYTSVNR